ncbi:10290_t:CDS:2 [Entrophospora sp. SA101]|nr:10290_t:CDS:2 [Entrophospora sp. SA101]
MVKNDDSFRNPTKAARQHHAFNFRSINPRKFNDAKSVIIRLLKEVNSSNYETITDKVFVLLSDTNYTKQPRNVIKGGIDIINKEICMKKEVEIETVKGKQAEDKLIEYYQSCALILVRLIEKFKNVKVKKGKVLIDGNVFIKNYLVNWVKDTFYKLVRKGGGGTGSFIKSNKLISVCCFIGELYLFNIITSKVLNTFVEKLINYNYYNNNNNNNDSNSSISQNFIQSNNTKTYLTNYYRKLESLMDNSKVSNENKIIIKGTIEHLDGLLLLSSIKNQNDKTKGKKAAKVVANNITKVVAVEKDQVDKKVDELEISTTNDLTANNGPATDVATSSDQINGSVEIINSDEDSDDDKAWGSNTFLIRYEIVLNNVLDEKVLEEGRFKKLKFSPTIN